MRRLLLWREVDALRSRWREAIDLMTRTEPLNKRVGERNVATPILSKGKKKNKGPVKPVFHRAFVVWGREVFPDGLGE